MKKCNTGCGTTGCKNKVGGRKAEGCGKREKVRKACKAVRAKVRGKCRGAACAVALLAVLSGCANATPSSKAQSSVSKGNTVQVILNVAVSTNAVACVGLPAGGLNINLSDVIGTQVQSADAGRDDTASLSATATNPSGVTGDKPIEVMGEVGKAAITGGASGAVKAVTGGLTAGDGTETADAAKAAAACTTGTCPK